MRGQLDQALAFTCRVSGGQVTGDFEAKAARYPHYRGYEVFLYGDGTLNRRRSAHDRSEFAATYEQWGHFLNYLFTVDPTLAVTNYPSRAEFDRQTGNKFQPPVGLIHREDQ